MAFRASTVTQAVALQGAMQQALWIKQIMQAGVQMLSGTTNANQIFQLVDNIVAARSMLSIDASVPGIAAYAQAQVNDPAYDIATEFTNMMNSLQACIDWVVTNFPNDAQGFAQAYTLNPDGSRTAATFTPTQTAGLTAALNAAIATIS